MKALLPLLFLAACATTRGTAPEGVYDDASDFAKLFELRVPVPEGTRSEAGIDDSVRGVQLKRRDLHWAVERRGGGLPASPLPMTTLATRFAAAFGVEGGVPTEAEIAGRPAARLEFEADGQYRVVHTVFDGGWVYGIQVSGPPGDRQQVDAYSAAILGRTEFPQAQMMVPPVEPTLADLGVAVPYLDGWSGMGEKNTIARVSQELGVAVVITRSAHGDPSLDIADALREVCPDAGDPRTQESGLGPGLTIDCATAGRNAGEVNQSEIFAISRGPTSWLILVTSPAERAAAARTVLEDLLATISWAE